MQAPELIEWILSEVRTGESQASIARALNIAPSTLCEWLQETPELAERSARARKDSAEAWLDKGIDTIESSLKRSSGVDPNAARAYAQECARRAAVRNPAYREKQGLELSGPNGEAIKFARIERVIVDPAKDGGK